MVSFYIEIEVERPGGYQFKGRGVNAMSELITKRIFNFLSAKLGKYPDCEIAAREILKELRG